ncbi:hypothetical protein P7K49_007136 [Saguinus oedipus]|uniref:CARMIL C-terminal domain-containing protein n=1 Tax=Saguinus oedipus TaxID=9490 RepID=A0ABQ9VUL1_SAGOE|nr:hypothetical protein P7K49_007136 [Saguinus oedipus]
MTPKSKRKSIHSRMLRPVSRAFEMEFDLDKALEEVPIHIEDPPLPSLRQEKRSSGFISELPSEEGKKLEHFTKLRPKRNKKQQPTQAAVREQNAILISGSPSSPSLSLPPIPSSSPLMLQPFSHCFFPSPGLRTSFSENILPYDITLLTISKLLSCLTACEAATETPSCKFFRENSLEYSNPMSSGFIVDKDRGKEGACIKESKLPRSPSMPLVASYWPEVNHFSIPGYKSTWRLANQDYSKQLSHYPMARHLEQVCAANIVSQDGEQNGLMGRVDEGVDEFFTKKVTKMDSKYEIQEQMQAR